MINMVSKTKKDRFLKSAGGWKDTDAKALIKKIYESRSVIRRKIKFD